MQQDSATQVESIFQPHAESVARSRLRRAWEAWGFDSFEDFHRRSVDDPEWFWKMAVEDLSIEFTTPFDRVKDESEGQQFPSWFVGGRINAAELCSHRHARGVYANKTAVIFEGDDDRRRSMTYAELDAEVRMFASNLIEMGVRRGDRVVLFLPPNLEAVAAFLGCAMIGAISVPAFSGYGVDALATRLRDSAAKVLVTATGTTRRGKVVDLKGTADAAVAQVNTVHRVVVVNHPDIPNGDPTPLDVQWQDLSRSLDPATTEEMDSNDPLTIVYTSGTTGKPKGIVHSHGGFAAKAAVDFAYGFDVHEDDTVAWIADMGWLIGPLLIMGGLQLGATLVLAEGVPDYPRSERFWELVERHIITILGVAPTAVRALLARNAEPPTQDLSSLRAIASTGEAWDESTWRWLFETVGGKRIPIMNYTGGTEVGGGILVSYPFLPSNVAGFNGPLPGVDAGVADSDGSPVVGRIGELVVYNTFPGMTHAFWQDRDRYIRTYWTPWSDIWRHGDLASVDELGYWKVHGRSDDTIKVSGRRVGPAEIETALLKDSRITEAAAIGVPDPRRGQRIIAFVTTAAESDRGDLAKTATENVGRSFAPELVVVESLPKTKNGKIMRRAIRSQYLGQETGDMSSLDPSTPLSSIPTLNDTALEA